MHELLNLTKKFLPELEKISKTSKKKSFKFKARKIARTVFNSMQAHVDRLTQYSKRYNEISRRNNVYLSSSYVPPKILSKRSVRTIKKSNVSLSQTSAKSKAEKSTLKSATSLSTKNSKRNKKKKNVKTKDVPKTPKEVDDFDITHMKRDEFLTYLKNLQQELSALKIPDLTISPPPKKIVKKTSSRGREVPKQTNFSQGDLSGIARCFNEAYAQVNSPLADAFKKAEKTGLLPNTAPFGPKGFFEWAQKPLKAMHFPKID